MTKSLTTPSFCFFGTVRPVASFAWIGDDDVFSLLYNPEQDLALKVGIDLSAPSALYSATTMITDIAKLSDLKKLKDIASAKTIANKVVDTASKLQSLKGELGGSG